jgi:uncharacterized membrane protein
MNEAHWHLVVNHIPIIFPIVGVIVMIIGLLTKSNAVKRTAYLIFILGALATIFAMKTGEGAEDVVEKINGISENYIEIHEEAAEKFALFSYILGGISTLGLWLEFKKNKLSFLFTISALLVALIVLFLGKQTGTTGGEIRHTEIRENSNNVFNSTKNKQEEEEDED